MRMNREKLNRHKQNKRELALIERQLDKLYERLEGVETVSGKVTKSGDDFPYIEEHITVQMAEPKAATAIKDRIREKEARREKLLAEIEEVENFIASLPESIEKEIMEMIYIDGMSQQDVGDTLNLERSGISKKINACLKDSQHSHF